MFTGIIQSIGSIAETKSMGIDCRLGVYAGKLDLASVNHGDSIAVNGVCLTVINKDSDKFWADVSTETLERTCIGKLQTGSRVNLEKALTLATPLGGHLVSGHVDGIGEVISRHDSGRSTELVMRAPAEIAKYIAVKGSVCVDGISLTVNAVDMCQFRLTIVPHTLKETIMDEYKPGTRVNLEVDIIARYLERLIQGQSIGNASDEGITEALLKKAGYID